MSWNIKTPGDYINGPLTVTGSATITGDLTVATDALKVNSSTKDICIGTTTPTFNNKLTVVGGAGGDAFITSGNGTRTGYIGTDGTNVIMGAYSNHPLRIHVNDYPQMEVAALGVFNWYDGAGGTRMTLNATGLGVGASPTANCKLSVNGGVFLDRGATGGASQLLAVLAASSGGNFGQISNTGTRWALGYGSTLTTVGTEALIWDSSGNVGIGVAGPSYRLQANVATGGDRNIFAAQVTGASNGFQVQWNNGTQKLRVNFSDLPTSSAGLPVGTLWIDTTAGNTLKIA